MVGKKTAAPVVTHRGGPLPTVEARLFNHFQCRVCSLRGGAVYWRGAVTKLTLHRPHQRQQAQAMAQDGDLLMLRGRRRWPVCRCAVPYTAPGQIPRCCYLVLVDRCIHPKAGRDAGDGEAGDGAGAGDGGNCGLIPSAGEG